MEAIPPVYYRSMPGWCPDGAHKLCLLAWWETCSAAYGLCAGGIVHSRCPGGPASKWDHHLERLHPTISIPGGSGTRGYKISSGRAAATHTQRSGGRAPPCPGRVRGGSGPSRSAFLRGAAPNVVGSDGASPFRRNSCIQVSSGCYGPALGSTECPNPAIGSAPEPVRSHTS